jgi:hypothetical protein
MKLVNGRSAISIDSWRSPRAVKIHVKITVAAIPTTKPKTRVPNAGWRNAGDGHDADTQCNERAKLRSDDHSSNNEDRLIKHDSDASDHGRDDHETGR